MDRAVRDFEMASAGERRNQHHPVLSVAVAVDAGLAFDRAAKAIVAGKGPEQRPCPHTRDSRVKIERRGAVDRASRERERSDREFTNTSTPYLTLASNTTRDSLKVRQPG